MTLHISSINKISIFYSKICKESRFISIFVQSRHYFFQVFYVQNLEFFEYFQVKFCLFLKSCNLAIGKGHHICVRNVEGHIAPQHTVY